MPLPKWTPVAAVLATVPLVVFATLPPSPTQQPRLANAARSLQGLAGVEDRALDFDPGQDIRGRIHSRGSETVRVLAVERLALARQLIERGSSEVPLPIPVRAATAPDGEGNFSFEDIGAGQYSLYCFGDGLAPTRLDGMVVRNTVGSRGAELRPEPAVRKALSLPGVIGPGTGEFEVLTLYEGHWPDLTWTPTGRDSLEVEYRKPDGWPRWIAWRSGPESGWLQVDSEDESALRPLAEDWPIREAGLLRGAPWVSRSTAAAMARLWSQRSPAGASYPLRVHSMDPYAIIEATDSSGHSTAAFTDAFGETVIDVLRAGPVVLRALSIEDRAAAPIGRWIDDSAEGPTNEVIRLGLARVESGKGESASAGIQVRERARMFGFVTNGDAPVAGARVELQTERTRRPLYTVTDEHGFYQLDGVETGSYGVAARGKPDPGIVATATLVEFDATARGGTRIDIVLGGGDVVLELPTELEGARLRIDTIDGVSVLETAVRGVDAMALRGFADGSYRARASHGAGAVHMASFQVNGDAVRVMSGEWVPASSTHNSKGR